MSIHNEVFIEKFFGYPSCLELCCILTGLFLWTHIQEEIMVIEDFCPVFDGVDCAC